MSVPDFPDSERTVSTKYLVVLGICALTLAAYLVSSFFGGPPAPGTLASRALSQTDANERKRAAEELASIVDRVAALPNLQRVAKETQDPEVLAIVLSRLLFLRDTASLPLCFAALKHSSKEVRAKVYFSLQAYYGGSLPGGIEYSPDAPAEELAQVVSKLDGLQSRQSSMMSGPMSPANPATMVAAAKKEETPHPTPAVAKKDEAPIPSTTTPAPPSSSVAPAPSAPPSLVVLAPSEHPAINLLVWMFRVLAVFLVICEIIGAISLVIGEHPGKSVKFKDTPPSLAEELEAVLAKNSAGLWLKIAILVAGAICAAALLMAAEMSQMAVQMNQLAVRVEQKLDNLPPNR